MPKKSAKLFEYLAFDDTSQAILAHGRTAVDALRAAARIALDAPIYILEAGNLGWMIWSQRLNLGAANSVLECCRAEISRFWMPFV